MAHSRKQKEVPEPEASSYGALLAIDWADQKHVWALQVTGAARREQGEIEHRVEAVDEWIAGLLKRVGGQPVAVCLEQSRGALIYLLMKYPALVLYPIHPATVARFRAALYPSGSKDDPKDAELQLDLLAKHRDKLRAWKPDTVETRMLQLLVEQRRQLVDDRTAANNRLTQVLKQYYPQALCWFEDVTSVVAGAFLLRWPTLESVQRVRPQTLRVFFHQHNCRSEELIEERIEQVSKAMTATGDGAIVQSSVLLVQHLVKLMTTLRDSIHEVEQKIEAVAKSHPNFAVFDSFPGAGEVLVPRLIAAFGTQDERFANAAELQSFTGIGPVVERSGNTKWVHFRWACPKFLRQTFHEWAGHSIGYSGWARAYYQQQRDKGNDHHAAVRSLAAKWIRIAFRCWRDGKPYNEKTYLEALRRRGSPLIAKLAQTA